MWDLKQRFPWKYWNSSQKVVLKFNWIGLRIIKSNHFYIKVTTLTHIKLLNAT